MDKECLSHLLAEEDRIIFRTEIPLRAGNFVIVFNTVIKFDRMRTQTFS